jgi:hypothetical protein
MERPEIEFTETKRGKGPLYLVSTNIGVAVKRAANTACGTMALQQFSLKTSA